MLKNLKNIAGVTKLSKNEQKNITGGDSFMCLVMCGPGSGNTPIYGEQDYYLYDGTVVTIPEEIGCVCA
ncbi:hypothetical protein C8N46_10444 [Kordia periserrulae]|uniref:Uncharacterized protein n=1 Tax=Kordia periserrulae TaxID=701523 RepID=A0A2T6BZA3_9FLAO|nr:hypothetical protein [Kordia periserrulae]PTX61401.1 hypothetical protein C8N46_10444 [Kordia periserrulae]